MIEKLKVFGREIEQIIKYPLNKRKIDNSIIIPDNAGKSKILINSVPKCGTHLMGKLFGLLGFYDLKLHLLDLSYWDYNQKGNLDKWEPLKGKENFLNPKMIRINCRLAMQLIQSSQYSLAHINYKKSTAETIDSLKIKHVFMIRDPRDVAISFYKHATYKPEKVAPIGCYNYFNSLDNNNERIQAVIKGVPNVMPNIRERYDNKLKWLEEKNICVVKFEDIIGEKGGGTENAQKQTLEKVLDYIEISKTDELYNKIKEQLFGGNTNTFNKGQIGSWKTEFSNEHKTMFKNIAGNILIKLGYEENNNW